LPSLIGTSLSSAVGAAVGGGEGEPYGAANYQYNYLTHEQAKELTDAEKALEACKASPTTCSDTYKAQLQSQVETLKNLDYQTTMSLLQACLDQGALACTTEQNKWLAAYKTWRDADSAADRNDPNYEQMLENYRNLAAAGLVAKELGKTQEYGEVYQMTKGFELGAVSGAVAALGTIPSSPDRKLFPPLLRPVAEAPPAMRRILILRFMMWPQQLPNWADRLPQPPCWGRRSLRLG